MKNIYLTPTKIGEGKLFMDSIDNELILKPDNTNIVFKDCEYYNVNIISDEKIKRGDWVLSFLEDESYGTSFKIEENHFYCGFDFEEDLKKIILTTDQDLIKNGVQAIDDEFLEWFVRNPSCEKFEVISMPRCCGRCDGVDDLCLTDMCCNDHQEYGCEICYGKRSQYKIIIPKEELKQERMYSEEEVLNFTKYMLSKKVTVARSISDLEEYLPKEFQLLSGELMRNGKELISEWFEQSKKKV